MVNKPHIISFRVSEGFKKELMRLADESKRSLSNFIIFKLEEVLESNEREGDKSKIWAQHYVKTKHDDE